MTHQIGFTGSSTHITESQCAALDVLFLRFHNHTDAVMLHHGDCVMADAYAHTVAQKLGWGITLHPPVHTASRAFCEGWTYMERSAPYLARNRVIARDTAFLVAMPTEPDEQRRSGTWATVRYARALDHPVFIIRPDGLCVLGTKPPRAASDLALPSDILRWTR